MLFDGGSRPGERGSASLEFIAVGVILLVPLAYLILVLGTVQDQLLGVESAARHTARVVSTSGGAAEADARAARVVDAAIDEYRMDAASVATSVRCVPAAATCPSAGATVVVTVSAEVSLPFMPAVFGLERFTRIPVEASSAYKVSRTWTAG